MIEDMLLERARRGVGMLTPQGFMAPGRNGAYGDIDTPVRNTAHWLTSFSYAYRLTGDPQIKAAAERALAYLLKCCGHFRGSVIFRMTPGKDYANGMMGPAMIIEGLYYASQALGSDEAYRAAFALINKYSFNTELRCWNCLSPDGKIMPPDMTYNHQLYFGAVAGLVSRHDAALRRDIEDRLRELASIFEVRDDGRIVHHIKHGAGSYRGVREMVAGLKPSTKRKIAGKEVHYQLYNLYAFALLQSTGIDIEKMLGDKIKRAFRYAESPPVAALLREGDWGTNLHSGTETAACDYAFYKKVFCGGVREEDLALAQSQFTYIEGPDQECMSVSPDPVTHRARHYRLWRLLSADPFQ